MEKLWELAALHSSDQDIAHYFNFNLKTWIVYKADHPEIQQLVSKARAVGAENLRKAQWNTALNGNVNMQIWLGRCILNQNREEMFRQPEAAQLSDISPESRENLIELRNAIYGKSEADEPQEVELTHVNPESNGSGEGKMISFPPNPPPVGSAPE